MNNQAQCSILRKLLIPFCLFFSLWIVATKSNAQEKPPRPIEITVSTEQHLNFGTIIQSGVYGTVTVSSDGIRSATGSIILPNMSSNFTPALFRVESEPGTLITILNGSTAILTGSNGGSLNLTLGEASVGNHLQSQFVTQSQYTDVFIGGTLVVDALSADPAGFYSGTFQVTFIQQ